jgi:hypothetical protein
MTAMSRLLVAHRIERPAYAWVAVALQLFTAVMAVPVGFAMILDANGSPLGIPNDWIAGTPFGSFLVPGIVLLCMNGAGQLSAAILVWQRHPLAPWVSGFFAVGLMVWIAVQVLVIPFSAMQPALFGVGFTEGVVSLAWLWGLRRA